MNIHEYGHHWKDTYPGVWTAVVTMFGRSMTAYAIEVDAVSHTPIDTYDAQEYYRRHREAIGYEEARSPIALADMHVIIFIV